MSDQKKSKLVHLHCHSEYSSLDGGSKVKDMPEKLKSLGMDAMALTDHGVMQGIPEFYETLKKADIKPILGLEAYLTPDRHDRSKGTPTWHLTLLAENAAGYKNLCKISSWAFIDGVIMTFGRPRARADWELLEKYSEGIICLTGCMAGPVMSSIMSEGSITLARRYTERMIEIFGKENVYGEIQNVGITTGIPGDSEVAELLGKKALSKEEASKLEGPHADFSDDIEEGEVALSQTEANGILIEEVCKPLGLKWAATGDVHYLEEDDADPHDAMLCIGTGQIKKGRRRFSLLPKKYHMRSEEEMLEALENWPESLETTREIADRCDVEIEFDRSLLPRFPIPEGEGDPKAYLRKLCEEGLAERYPADNPFHGSESKERLDFELGVIDSMGFNDYFLITWDLFNEARKRNIPAGPGRGSAAGSIVAYTLGITQLCPLEHEMLFERFLNPDRISMPDIDMDFSPLRREELIEYAREKYNTLAECDTAVAQIVTFSKFKAKGALRDAARVLAEPTDEGRAEALKVGDRLASFIPGDPKATMRSVWEDKDEGAQLRKAFKQGGFQAEVIKQAGWLEGFVRAYSIHAAAVLIADHDLTEDLPLQRFGADKPLHVQYDMGYSEKLGLLKMDFLGLRNLDVIWDAIEKIKHVHGVELEPYGIPIDDAKTYELFAKGESIGTFQFESSGMISALKEIGPTELNDLIAIVALYRPGAMAHIPAYAARKHGREPVEYLDPRLEEFQSKTYAITIYQEQSMQIARALAGFTPGEADDLRKAIGKKQHDRMAALKPKYLEGCKKNGVAKEVAEALWADNEAAADYSFNLAHAACYAYVSYITGYLKANYPNEYMAALLSSVMSKKDKPRLYLTEAKRMGLNVLPPDVNRSLRDFAVLEREEEPGEFDVLFGLTAIRNVGAGIADEIRAEREAGGPFTSLFDLIRRMPQLTKGQLEALIKGGALDCTGATRQAMFSEVDNDLVKRLKKERTDAEKAYANLIKGRLEEMEATGEQQATKKGTRKLTTAERRGVEGGCLKAFAAHQRGEVAEDEALIEGVIEALTKEDLRAARAAARKRLKEASAGEEASAGIADEENADGESEKDRIEREAQETLEAGKAERQKTATRIVSEIAPVISAEREESAADDEGLQAALAAETDPKLTGAEWDDVTKLNFERSMLGVYVTGHPLEREARKWAHYVDQGLGNISDEQIGSVLKVVGAIVGATPIKTRKGDIMYRVELEDLTGAREVTIFPKTLEGGLEEMLEVGQVICMEVGVEEDTFQQARQEETAAEGDGEGAEAESEKPIKVIASRLYRWDPSKLPEPPKGRGVRTGKEPEPITVEVTKELFSQEWVRRLEALVKEHPGENPIRIVLDGKPMKTQLRAKPSDELTADLHRLLEPASA